MRLLHSLARTQASFDDPNLVSHAGLVPVMALAQRAGLADLIAEHVRPGGECGVDAYLKVGCLVAGMAAGADSIDDMDLLRHGAMSTVFGGVRAPSTLGSHLRCYAWGNVSQLEKAGREFLIALAGQAPLLPGAGTLAFIDIDSMQKRIYGHHKQGARFGHTKIQGKSLLVRGLNALAAVISTPLSAPGIAAARLRGGNAASARGAASLAARAIGTARECGCTGTIVVRMDSAFCNAAVTGAIRRAGARFSVTVPMNASIRAAIAAIAAIGEDVWTAIKYPRAIWDDQLGTWVSDAEIAETQYTAFTSRKGQEVTARLIVRRVRDLNKQAGAGQDELFPAWRYHAVFTDSPFELIQAEGQHRGHAIVEQVFADVTSGPLAHMPSGVFAANAAWLSIAAMAHNLLRAAGALASLPFAKARAATIRRDLIAVAARTARHGRGGLTLHLPEGWHREHEWLNLLGAACGPPAAAA
ncbi:MAG TPA: IS1380 family transposase [Streptosporangiaceae bacterium]|nr:IS1380 family transposase [Streptosporangiaceae bacterium]